MNSENFKNLVLTRQACRSFLPKKVEKEKLVQICDTARLSPSACNSQPWKIYAVSSPEKVAKVCESLQENGRNAFLSNATAFVVVSETKAVLKPDVTHRFSETHFVKYDVGEVLAYITLTAQTLGVSSCIIGYINQEKLRTAVNMTAEEECNVVVALGYSNVPVREKIRRPYEDVVIEL